MKEVKSLTLAAEDIPAYKLEVLGNEAMTRAELLSIIIGNGGNKYNALEVSKELLAQNNNSLIALSKAPVSVLSNLQGIGKVKASRIKASLCLGKKLFEEKRIETSLKNASAVYEFLKPKLSCLDREVFYCVFCDTQYNILKAKMMFSGGINATIVDVRIIVREAILCSASTLFVAHNHPSGSTKPSITDDQLTMKIKNACDFMDIRFIDHVIITENSYYSYSENGKL